MFVTSLASPLPLTLSKSDTSAKDTRKLTLRRSGIMCLLATDEVIF